MQNVNFCIAQACASAHLLLMYILLFALDLCVASTTRDAHISTQHSNRNRIIASILTIYADAKMCLFICYLYLSACNDIWVWLLFVYDFNEYNWEGIGWAVLDWSSAHETAVLSYRLQSERDCVLAPEQWLSGLCKSDNYRGSATVF